MYKNIKKIILTTSFFLALSITNALAEKRIAVLPFDVPESRPDMKQFGVGITDTINIVLSNFQDFVMIDRSQLQNVLKEQAAQQSGFIDSEKAVKVGKILGAEVLVVGAIQHDGINYRITARMTEVETGKIIKAVQVTGTNIFELQDKLASEIISQQKVVPNEGIISRIKNVINATQNVDAYNYYLKGKDNLLKSNINGYKEAIEFFDKALETDKSYSLALAAKAEAQALLASEYEVNAKPYKSLLEKAIENANTALSQQSYLGDAHRALSTIYKMQGNFEDGKKEAKKALDLNPNDADAYYLLWSNSTSNLEDPLIQKAVSINPFIVKKHFAIGYAYFKQSKYQEAIDVYSEVIKINPKFILAHVALGYAYERLGQYDRAEESFKQAISLNKSVADGHAGLGFILFRKGNLKEAFNEYDKALKANPNYALAHTGLGYVYFALGKKDNAFSSFKTAIEINPDDFYARNALGYYYYDKGDFELALNEFKAALGINYNDVDARYNIGNIYLAQKNYPDAIIQFKEALDIYPKFEQARFKLAQIYNEQGKLKEALLQYTEIIKSNPENYIVLSNIGIIYYKQSKHNEAVKVLQEALKIKYDVPSTHNNLGIVYYAMGKINESIKEYNEAILINPQDINAHENLSIAYNKLGKKSEAQVYLKKACMLGSESSCQSLSN